MLLSSAQRAFSPSSVELRSFSTTLACCSPPVSHQGLVVAFSNSLTRNSVHRVVPNPKQVSEFQSKLLPDLLLYPRICHKVPRLVIQNRRRRVALVPIVPPNPRAGTYTVRIRRDSAPGRACRKPKDREVGLRVGPARIACPKTKNDPVIEQMMWLNSPKFQSKFSLPKQSSGQPLP